MNQRRIKNTSNNNLNYSDSEEEDSEEDNNSSKENDSPSKGKGKKRQRQENSLGELTKNFVNYIRQQNEKEININEVVKKLNVKKRRIYDITNVLEGIGYIKKNGKNKIEWLFDELYKKNTIEEEDETLRLLKELESLNQQETKLDQSILDAKKIFENVFENENYDKYGYVTYEDIKSLTNGNDVNYIAVKAPTGTSLEIPDPENILKIYNELKKNIEEGKQERDEELLSSLLKKYQLFLDSPNGEINVYLILSNNDDQSNKNDFSDSIMKSPISTANMMMKNNLSNRVEEVEMDLDNTNNIGNTPDNFK